MGTCVLGAGVTVMQAILMEAVITFLLVFVVYATVIDKRANPRLAGFAIGFVDLFGVMVGGPISGGSLNPARVFGPALASGHFANHYVWWIGPILGGVVAGFVYEYLFAEKSEELLSKKVLERTNGLVRGTQKLKELVGKRISSLHY